MEILNSNIYSIKINKVYLLLAVGINVLLTISFIIFSLHVPNSFNFYQDFFLMVRLTDMIKF